MTKNTRITVVDLGEVYVYTLKLMKNSKDALILILLGGPLFFCHGALLCIASSGKRSLVAENSLKRA